MKVLFWTILGAFGLGALFMGCAHFMPRPEGEAGGDDKSSRFAVIDDAEDGDDQIALAAGRNGYIYTYVDDAGTLVEPSSSSFKATKGGAGGSEFALRFKGQTAKAGEVYAGMGFSFREPMGPYDASRCKGISFIAKKGPGGTDSIKVKVPDINTAPEGGVCKECYNDFGIGLKVTEEWTRYVVAFTSLKQESGWGNPKPATVDASKLFGIQWQTAALGATFDFWIDNIEFVECEK